MVGLIELSAGLRRPALGDELGVPPGNRPIEEAPGVSAPDAAQASGEEPRRRTAMARVYAALCRAAEAGYACPSNRDLCAIARIAREAKVTTLLAGLDARRMIGVEWTAPMTGARRVVIRASGKRTGWSLHGPRWPGEADGIPRNGMQELAKALRRTGRRFEDVSIVEARRVARDTPVDPGMPPAARPSSYMGCALSHLVRGEPDELEGDAVAAGP